MRRCSTIDLRRLEIVNLCDGSRLGYACDFEFDCEDAKILALVIRGGGGFLGFGKDEDIVIPWRCIECIGEDTILVRLSPQELASCSCSYAGKKNKRFHF